jgi:hypothetical protein
MSTNAIAASRRAPPFSAGDSPDVEDAAGIEGLRPGRNFDERSFECDQAERKGFRARNGAVLTLFKSVPKLIRRSGRAQIRG